jgi:hypothetical protein
MAENPKAPTAAETKNTDPSIELSKLRRENAELRERLEQLEREAGQMRTALEVAREEGKLGGLPKGAAQLAESFTFVLSGKMVDARPGDVLLTTQAQLENIRKRLPPGNRAFVVDPAIVDEVRARKLARE